ncbi:MAG: hypothetical protein JRG86_22690 [Deltaproteobacteria bacterium]|jgi:hypothetical protein|nr:hypothetical protein [Deltaproteobacteria bacterium]MBW2499034.1 hypothetical protein [Deltaproteobacteria bacterium]
MEDDSEKTVRALLAAAGIRPPEDEIEKMVRAYPGLRAAADSMFTDEIARFLPAFSPTNEDLEER